MDEKGFRAWVAVGKGLWFFVKCLGACLAGVEATIAGLGLPQDWETWKKAWPSLLISVLLGAARTVENTRKTWNLPDPAPMWEWGAIPRWFWNLRTLITGACVLVVLGAGCVTTRFHNEYTSPDGRVSATDYRVVSAAWPLGKLDTTAHKLETQFGAGHVAVGQDAAGMDNTGQAALIEAVIRGALGAVKVVP